MFRTLLISMFLTSTALADTWTVDDDGKADFGNIQAAVDAASDGDEIIVMPGVYTSTHKGYVINTLGKEITLRSSNPADPEVVSNTIIDGENESNGHFMITTWSSLWITDRVSVNRMWRIHSQGFCQVHVADYMVLVFFMVSVNYITWLEDSD